MLLPLHLCRGPPSEGLLSEASMGLPGPALVRTGHRDSKLLGVLRALVATGALGVSSCKRGIPAGGKTCREVAVGKRDLTLVEAFLSFWPQALET